MKKTIKKVMATILVATLVFSMLALSGCGNKTDYTVGVCQIVAHEALDKATEGFSDGLMDELNKAGKTVTIEVQEAQGDSTICSTIINSYVSKNVDLIMANATAPLQTAFNATSEIPIIGTSITTYDVALNLSNFNGTVGGNVSGMSDLAPLDTQAQMILDLVPTAKSVGLLYCSAEPNSTYQVKVVEEYLTKKGITCNRYSFSDSNDIAAVTNKAADECDVIYVPTDNTAAANASIIDSICMDKKVPVFAGEEGICKGCGFATLSISYYKMGYEAGVMAAKVLLGEEDISKMPIGYDSNPVKKCSKSRCEALGIAIPEGYETID